LRWFQTDVSGLPINPIFKGQAVQEEGKIILKSIIVKYGVRIVNDLSWLKAGANKLPAVVKTVMNFWVS
jgi:hypothetical protein